jgi:hypothetical protein
MMRVNRYEGLGALPDAYEALFVQGARACFFVGLPWFRLFERSLLEPEERVAVYGVEEDDAGGAASPESALVLRERGYALGPFRVAVLESLANYYTPQFALPGIDDRDPGAIASALAAALWDDGRRWDVLHLWPLDRDAPSFHSLVGAFRDVGMWVQTHFCFGNRYLEVAGRSYSEYFRSLPGVLRKNVPYAGRRLERSHRVRLEIVTGMERLERSLADYEIVYRASWRPFESHPEFLRRLALVAAERDALRLGLLYLDDVPAAAEFWILHQGVASIYKVCYDERFAKLSVGNVLTARLMEHVIDRDQVRVVDYLSGDDSYKTNWMSHRRERWGIMAFNPRRAAGVLLAARHLGGRALKRAFARSRSPSGATPSAEAPT